MSLMQTIYTMLRFQLTGLSFLFVLLPLMLLTYYLFPLRMRPAVLLAESLLLYRYGNLGNLWVMVASVAADYLLLRLMEYWDDHAGRRRLCLLASVGKNALLLIGCGVYAQVENLPLQIGLPVYTLSALNCLLGVYRRQIPYERSPIRFGLYCCFFPTLFAGPLHPYMDYVRSLQSAHLEPARMMRGAGQFVQGAFKTAIFGGSLYSLSQAAAALPGSVFAAWLQVFAYAFAFYYMLSGFGDMAAGAGAMFAIALPRNFYYPFQSRSMEDFFERFHSTVGGFFRDAVAYALAGWKNRRAASVVGVLAACMLLGLWFGLRPGYVLWGLYLGVFIVMERYLYPRVLENLPTLFCRLGTLCLVLAGFTVFAAGSLQESAGLIGAMFSLRAALQEPAVYLEPVLYLLGSNWLLLLLGVFIATNITNLVIVKFRRAAPAVSAAVLGLIDLGILFVYVALSL